MSAREGWDLPRAWSNLSPRQQDILRCLARGHSNQQIADELEISYFTVRNALADLYDEFNLSNRVQALLWVLANEQVAHEMPDSIHGSDR